MAKKLYVGNLSFSVNDEQLNEHFRQFGTVESARVITDRDSGRSKGFGFVEMSTDDEASKAMEALNGQDFEGRRMMVSEAKPQEPRSGGGFRPRSGGGGGANYSGGRGGGGGGFRPRGNRNDDGGGNEY